MQVHQFIAESAPDAVAQIRAQLGPEAVVVNVRHLPAGGLSRLWQKPRIEVLACVPPAAPPASDALMELRQEIAEIKQSMPFSRAARDPLPGDETTVVLDSGAQGKWRVGNLLQQTGVLPRYAQTVVDRLQALHGLEPPDPLRDELVLAREVLTELWTAPSQSDEAVSRRPQVFIGPPGSGKTTFLCKWLTQSVLVEGRSARVWRLDGRTANAAESLSVYADILGVPLERSWLGQETDEEMLFVDLPGVPCGDAAAVSELARQIGSLPQPQVHLVLNLAYETPLLLAQVRNLASLPITDLVLTHLDEEARWGKTWNLVLGTNYPVRFLGAGLNIPGDFEPGTPEKIFARQFPQK